MDFILLIFLPGFFFSDIKGLQPNDYETEVIPVVPEQEQAIEEPPHADEDIRKEDHAQNEEQTHTEEEAHEEQVVKEDMNKDKQENKENAEKNGNYKDTKRYVFTTKNPKDTESEITVSATTDLKLAVKNYNRVNKTGAKTEAKKPEPPIVKKQKPTTNSKEPEFWKKLDKDLGSTKENKKENFKDLFFQPIPMSDLSATTAENTREVENIKLKLMLGISLMSLLLFAILLAICSTLLYKIKMASTKTQYPADDYPVNPELVTLSYFQPSEGISDTSFSKSADSSTYWGTTSSEVRKLGTGESKSRITDMVSIASDDTGGIDESDLPHSDGLSEEIPTEPTEFTDHTDHTDPNEPIDLSEPIELFDPINTIDPINNTDFIDPNDPTNPTDATDATNAANAADPTDE